MRLVNQHSTGIHAAVDTTDQGEQEQGEESEMEVDDAIHVHTREQVVNRLQSLLNECLALHEHSDAAAVRQLVLMALDRGAPGTPLTPEQLERLLMDITEGPDARFRRSNNHSSAQRDFWLAMWRNLKYSSESDSDHRRERPISKDLHDSFSLKVELMERI